MLRMLIRFALLITVPSVVAFGSIEAGRLYVPESYKPLVAGIVLLVILIAYLREEKNERVRAFVRQAMKTILWYPNVILELYEGHLGPDVYRLLTFAIVVVSTAVAMCIVLSVLLWSVPGAFMVPIGGGALFYLGIGALVRHAVRHRGLLT